MEIVKAEIIMLSEEEGGRPSLLSAQAYAGAYRPHLVIGSRDQRKAIVKSISEHPNNLTELYQGVTFIDGPEGGLPINTSVQVVLALTYYPRMKYEDVVEGATFTLREGGRIVGHGEIQSRYSKQ